MSIDKEGKTTKYNSIAEAAESINGSISTIASALRGDIKTAYKMKWEYWNTKWYDKKDIIDVSDVIIDDFL